MATTTNFGWETPDDTDLVKDGALAIRTLGSAIDTSLVDLKGGTTGQVLSKTSNTDMDFTWVTSDDADAIQNAIVDAKGDLITATAADTPARLAVGSNGQVLTADSTTATGLKWASASSTPTFVGCSVNYNADYSVANTTTTALPWNGELFDTDSFHDNSTNNTRITIPSGKGGYYLCFYNFKFNANGTGQRISVLRKNGSTNLNQMRIVGTSTTFSYCMLTGIFNLSAGDYIEVTAYQDSGVSLNTIGGTSEGMFGVQFLGA